MNLNEFRKNIHSQNGEDGIIAEICRRLDWTSGWFVEFGAWDGRHLSNTYHLLSSGGWSGVYIEADPERFRDLQRTCSEFPGKAYPLCALVGFNGEGTLENLLVRTPIALEFELLSIDIDSYDWQVWDALEKYRPKMVVIESNCSIPPGVVSVHNPPTSVGASFTALVNLGKKKGYALVAHTGNCIFIRNDLVSRLGLPPELLDQPEQLFDRAKHRKEKLINIARKIVPDPLLQKLFCWVGVRKLARQK